MPFSISSTSSMPSRDAKQLSNSRDSRTTPPPKSLNGNCTPSEVSAERYDFPASSIRISTPSTFGSIRLMAFVKSSFRLSRTMPEYRWRYS